MSLPDEPPTVAPLARILVPFDGTPLAEDALEHALDTYPDADLTVLHVIDYVEESYGAEVLVGSRELRERAQDRSAAILADAESLAEEQDASITTATRIGDPVREIVDYADSHDVDMIVIGSHGRQLLGRVLLGSVAETVVRRAPSPVTVVR